jgi:hypothetical protein
MRAFFGYFASNHGRRLPAVIDAAGVMFYHDISRRKFAYVAQ